MTSTIPGLATVLDQADAFLIDQFGTIHDGETLYQGALETLRHLRDAGKSVILLSNSGRRATTNNRRLAEFGITSNLITASLCSGDVGWAALRASPPPCLRQPCRVLLFARSPALDILEGFDVTTVDTAADADLVMIAGSQSDRYGFDALWARMQPAIARNIPAICTNPDRVMLSAGTLHPGAGALAEAYAQAGGSVLWFGKPHPTIYEAAFAHLPGIPHHRIVGIGDSLEHDIAGAAAQGCRTILVRTGILAGHDQPALAAEATRWGYRPDFIMEKFEL